MAAELVASGHGDALVRCGVAWLPARTVAELFDHRRTDQDQSRGPEPRPKPSDHGYADIP